MNNPIFDKSLYQTKSGPRPPSAGKRQIRFGYVGWKLVEIIFPNQKNKTR